MLAFVLRRLLQAVIVMLAVGLIAFSLFRFVGDPVRVHARPGRDPRGARTHDAASSDSTSRSTSSTPTSCRAQRRATSGLQPAPGAPVSTLFVERLPATLELSLVAALLALSRWAFRWACIRRCERNSWLSQVLLAVSLIGVSLPTFLIGILLILVFAVSSAGCPPSAAAIPCRWAGGPRACSPSRG